MKKKKKNVENHKQESSTMKVSERAVKNKNITAGMMNAFGRTDRVRTSCVNCGLVMPIYAGRYPSACPNCGHAFETKAKGAKAKKRVKEVAIERLACPHCKNSLSESVRPLFEEIPSTDAGTAANSQSVAPATEPPPEGASTPSKSEPAKDPEQPEESPKEEQGGQETFKCPSCGAEIPIDDLKKMLGELMQELAGQLDGELNKDEEQPAEEPAQKEEKPPEAAEKPAEAPAEPPKKTERALKENRPPRTGEVDFANKTKMGTFIRMIKASLAGYNYEENDDGSVLLTFEILSDGGLSIDDIQAIAYRIDRRADIFYESAKGKKTESRDTLIFTFKKGGDLRKFRKHVTDYLSLRGATFDWLDPFGGHPQLSVSGTFDDEDVDNLNDLARRYGAVIEATKKNKKHDLKERKPVDYVCPECGSDDIEMWDDEEWTCADCGWSGDPYDFEESSKKKANLKEGIYIDTDHYRGITGRRPHGFGTWAFAFDGETDTEDLLFVNSSSYKDALAQAIAHAKEIGAREIRVMESAKRAVAYPYGELLVSADGIPAKAEIRVIDRRGTKAVVEYKNILHTVQTENVLVFPGKVSLTAILEAVKSGKLSKQEAARKRLQCRAKAIKLTELPEMKVKANAKEIAIYLPKAIQKKALTELKGRVQYKATASAVYVRPQNAVERRFAVHIAEKYKGHIVQSPVIISEQLSTADENDDVVVTVEEILQSAYDNLRQVRQLLVDTEAGLLNKAVALLQSAGTGKKTASAIEKLINKIGAADQVKELVKHLETLDEIHDTFKTEFPKAEEIKQGEAEPTPAAEGPPAAPVAAEPAPAAAPAATPAPAEPAPQATAPAAESFALDSFCKRIKESSEWDLLKNMFCEGAAYGTISSVVKSVCPELTSRQIQEVVHHLL